jgi:YggT family protein
VFGLIAWVLEAYLLVLMARIVLSWFPVSSGGFLATINGLLFALTEPVLAPLRRILPPVRMGGMAMDLSPLVVFFGLLIVIGLLPR